jgi:hypothetical protein
MMGHRCSTTVVAVADARLRDGPTERPTACGFGSSARRSVHCRGAGQPQLAATSLAD